MTSPITTHVLDTAQGRPAQGVPVVLEHETMPGLWEELGRGETGEDGRISDLLVVETELEEGVFRLTFEIGDYFEAQHLEGFYPYAHIVFKYRPDDGHYHIPLLVSPFGYSTYRGN